MKNNLSIFLILGALALDHSATCAQGPPNQKPANDNALIDLSAGVINAAVTREVNQTQRVSDVILGNPVQGTARTKARVSAELVPDAGNGVVDIFTRGTIVSDTVATPPDKGLLIYSKTIMPFTVRKRMYVNENGIYSFPTQARASADSRLIKVTNLQGQTGTLATNLAEEAFDITKPAAERQGEDHAQRLMIKEFDDQFQPQLVKGNAAFANALRKFTSSGVPLRRLHFSSTSSQLTLGALLCTTDQSPSLLPPRLTGPFDLAARVHQSAVNETALAMLGGKTFNVNDLGSLPGTSKMSSADAQLVQHFLGTIPKEMGVSVVYITFAQRDPVTAVFAGQGATLTVRVQEIRTAGLRLPGFTTIAVYKIENTPGRVELVRQGPVQVEPFQHVKIGNRALGTVLQGSLDHVFKSRVPVPDLTPPADLSQIGTLVPCHGDADNGWLSLTWVRQAAKAK